MKKIVIIGLAVILLGGAIVGCSNEGDITSTTILEQHTITSVPSITLHDVSISYPEKYIIRTGEEDEDYGFVRQYRASYYAVSPTNSISLEIFSEWVRDEIQVSFGSEQVEPSALSYIKYFNITFEEFERATKETYLLFLKLKADIHDERNEIHNPYLLYTFNLERINDYYSLDPARHASAVQWLEEWLSENEPYESYSAFKSANS